LRTGLQLFINSLYEQTGPPSVSDTDGYDQLERRLQYNLAEQVKKIESQLAIIGEVKCDSTKSVLYNATEDLRHGALPRGGGDPHAGSGGRCAQAVRRRPKEGLDSFKFSDRSIWCDELGEIGATFAQLQ
jgi:hypothetical protein